VGQGLLIIEASRSHSDTPPSVGLIWTSDQADAEISTWKKHITQKRQASITPGGIWTRNPNKRAAENPPGLAICNLVQFMILQYGISVSALNHMVLRHDYLHIKISEVRTTPNSSLRRGHLALRNLSPPSLFPNQRYKPYHPTVPFS
jgi:hypothetical protein